MRQEAQWAGVARLALILMPPRSTHASVHCDDSLPRPQSWAIALPTASLLRLTGLHSPGVRSSERLDRVRLAAGVNHRHGARSPRYPGTCYPTSPVRRSMPCHTATLLGAKESDRRDRARRGRARLWAAWPASGLRAAWGLHKS